ncbi:GNAT family N-acetyltransferase [Castellaniella sp.]|uniref:GNAT family N-acetyltransferase n=1 Tax=Castellaniella sp. TaxID=1955812 RepID=UPI003A4C5BAC
MRTLVLDKASWATRSEVTRGVIQDVWGCISDLADQYPDFHQWFEQKVIPGIRIGERTLLVEYRSGKIAGLVVLKETDEEQKLCCLRVMEDFHSTGLGIRLFERSFELLNNDKPLLSISDTRFPSFVRVCHYFGFRLEQELTGLYRPGHTEYVFNGVLSDNRHERELHIPHYQGTLSKLAPPAVEIVFQPSRVLLRPG